MDRKSKKIESERNANRKNVTMRSGGSHGRCVRYMVLILKVRNPATRVDAFTIMG